MNSPPAGMKSHGRAANYTFTERRHFDASRPSATRPSPSTTRNSCRSRESGWPGARSATRSKTVIRAGFGMYNDLQDALGYRTDQNAPFNPTYSLPNVPVSSAADLAVGAGAGHRASWCRAECSRICRRRR